MRKALFLSSVSWGQTWQRHHELASGLAGRGWRVAFVESTGKRVPRLGEVVRRRAAAPPPGVTVLTPRIIPPVAAWARRLASAAVGALARLIERALGGRPDAVVVHLPNWTSLDLVDRLEPGRVLYDCVSRFALMPGTIPTLDESERALCGSADAVWADGPALAGHAERQGAEEVRVVPPGCHYERWEAAPVRGVAPPRTVASFGGFVGPDRWPELLDGLAGIGYSVRVIGPVRRGALGPLVEATGQVAPEEVPGLLAGTDALVLPYRETPFNEYVVPAKTYECLATGLPVVATGLPSLAGIVEVVGPGADAEAVAAALAEVRADPEARERRRSLAAAQGWGPKIDLLEADLAA